MGLFSRKEKPKQQAFETNFINICELAEFQELQLRVLAFETCVNLIANAVAKCDFRTFKDNKRVKESEWYLWNVEPNPNQNSSEFLHKLVHTLYAQGEAIVVDNGTRSKNEYLAVAESFELVEPKAFVEQRYKGVVLNGTTMNKVYRESEVLHFKLNENNIKPVLDGITNSFEKLWKTAQSTYGFANGVHLKDHVDTIANEGDVDGVNVEQEYMKMLNNMVKPFLNSDKAVLPEFDGHTFTIMDIGGSAKDTRDIKELTSDVFEFTAKAFGIPPVLIDGKVADTETVTKWFLTFCVDPLLSLMEEEINRKRYGAEDLKAGNYMRISSMSIMHFDVIKDAPAIEKFIGSGFGTINEARDICELEASTDPMADELFITKNFAKMTTMKGGE